MCGRVLNNVERVTHNYVIKDMWGHKRYVKSRHWQCREGHHYYVIKDMWGQDLNNVKRVMHHRDKIYVRSRPWQYREGHVPLCYKRYVRSRPWQRREGYAPYR